MKGLSITAKYLRTRNFYGDCFAVATNIDGLITRDKRIKRD